MIDSDGLHVSKKVLRHYTDFWNKLQTFINLYSSSYYIKEEVIIILCTYIQTILCTELYRLLSSKFLESIKNLIEALSPHWTKSTQNFRRDISKNTFSTRWCTLSDRRTRIDKMKFMNVNGAQIDETAYPPPFSRCRVCITISLTNSSHYNGNSHTENRIVIVRWSKIKTLGQYVKDRTQMHTRSDNLFFFHLKSTGLMN